MPNNNNNRSSHKITSIEQRLDGHDNRLRSIENMISAVPRIETKLDQLIEANHGQDLAIHRVQNEARDERIHALSNEVDSLKKGLDDVRGTLDSWKYPIGILILVVTAGGIMALTGVDISTALSMVGK